MCNGVGSARQEEERHAAGVSIQSPGRRGKATPAPQARGGRGGDGREHTLRAGLGVNLRMKTEQCLGVPSGWLERTKVCGA